MEKAISIIIATTGTHSRLESLRRLLVGLYGLIRPEKIDHEIIVANNAWDGRAAQEVEKLIDEFKQADGKRFWHLREPLRGKCKAQNAAINRAQGAILAFLDDDVDVAPEWLRATVDFFENRSFAAMQGAVLIPPAMQDNEKFMGLYRRYKTIDFLQYRPGTSELRTLTGANMAIRREVFSQIGFFNEELGPGRSGMSEDVEFAQRIIRNGGRIGYEPRAVVYHQVDWSRLTEEYFRLRHEQQGRSRLLYKNQSFATILPNLMRSIWTFAWYSLVNNERKKYRAKGRYFHYKAMLLEKAKKLKGALL